MNKIRLHSGLRSLSFLRSHLATVARMVAILLVLAAISARGADPVINIQTGVKLSWPSVSGGTYRAQWAPDASGPWTDLGAPLTGTGTPLSLYDPVPAGTRSYQVVETPPSSLNTNILSGTPQATARITWVAVSGVQYQPESTDSLTANTWTSVGPLITGDGSTKEVTLPITGAPAFIRLRMPPPVIQPPSNVQSVASGAVNTIGLSWTASTSIGITGYRVLYGTSPGSLTSSLDFGKVTTGNIPGLEAGKTYYFSVVALTATGQSAPSSPVSIQNSLTPLFSTFTTLEPEITIDTPTSLVTKFSDRARDRHGREGAPADPVHDFHIYDHYLSWYWEERTISVTVTDTVGRGGSTVKFAYDHISPATITGGVSRSNFRAWFRGIGTVAEYHDNRLVDIMYPTAAQPQVAPFHYETTITTNRNYNRALAVGDRIEIEISQFIDHPVHGRTNYYGTVLLYQVGKGIVPWYAGKEFGLNGTTGDINTTLDSYPLPEAAWTAGKVSLPYQYSNEPDNRFKQMAGNISPMSGQLFMAGRRLHHTDFGDGKHNETTENPIFTEHVGNLGPKYVGRSCIACHINNGRALPPALNTDMLQSVVKVGATATGGPLPTIGSVLQPKTIPGQGTVEATARIASFTDTPGQYGDGVAFSLRKPNYTFTGVTPPFFSVRITPQLVGLGLLEAVSESTILALADANDSNGDGISGRAQVVLDPETGVQRLGRFGDKAIRASVRHQVAGALNTDMGVATSIFPKLDGDTNASTVEVTADELDKWTRYVSLLGVASKRSLLDADVISGETLFTSAGCAKCHVTTLTTSAYHPMTELRNQTIHPYTDLLLHDMGPGLADNLGEGVATGAEWRTAPLWSIGLTAGVSLGEAYLHDGRARTIEEAILWHGGEGETAKEAFRTMTAAQRTAVVKFIKAL